MTDERVRRGRTAGQFAKVPEALLFDPSISPNAKTAYAILHRYVDNRPDSDTEGAAFPGRERVAELMGKSVDTVDRALKELERAEWIDVERPAGGARNLYTVHEVVRTYADQWSAPVRTSRSAPTRTTKKETKENESKERKPPAPPASPTSGAEGLPSPLRMEAEALAKHVYDNRDPRPASPFIAWVKIFEKLLDVGWLPEQVRAAAMTASTISTGAMEVELNRSVRPPNGQAPQFLSASERKRARKAAERQAVVSHYAAATGAADPYAEPAPVDPFLAALSATPTIKELTA
jgi:DNA-binding transcriptional ArsR family regulator